LCPQPAHFSPVGKRKPFRLVAKNVPVYLYNETNNAVSQTLDAVASATTASDGTYASTWQ
jgi:hypothetical protein